MPEEGEPNWFVRWEEELPTPEELMPLSQTLISPHLALAFDISTTPSSPPVAAAGFQAPPPPRATVPPLQTHLPLHQDNHLPPPSGSYDSPELATAAAGGSADEPARTLKRPRLVWTPQLHKRFVDAVAHLGIKNAVPKTIMQLMNVDGLTRENVASHLQKYRLYLKRMQGLSSSAVAGGGGPVSAADECLFASAPLPHQFLSRGPPAAAVPRSGGGDQFMPFVQVASLQHHQQQMAATTAAHHQQLQYYHHRHMGHHMGSTPGGGFEHGYLARQQQQAGIQTMVGQGRARMVNSPLTGSYGQNLDVGAGAEVGRRKVMTLFPTGDD